MALILLQVSVLRATLTAKLAVDPVPLAKLVIQPVLFLILATHSVCKPVHQARFQ